MKRAWVLFGVCVAGLTAILGCSAGEAPSSVSVRPAADADAGIVERGALAVERRGCADCHQATEPDAGTLSGRTTPLPGTTVFPNNLTPDLQTGLGAWTDDQNARAIRDGFDAKGHQLCLQMARFKDMSDEEALELVTYLRSLPSVTRAIPGSHCGGIKP